MTLLEFSRQYSMPKTMGSEPTRRRKHVVVIPRPYCSPDPAGPHYEQYCRQSLMQHKSFRQCSDLLAHCESHVDAYAAFLQSGIVPPCLEDDIHRRQQQVLEEPNNTEVLLHVHTPIEHLHVIGCCPAYTNILIFTSSFTGTRQ